MLPVKIEIPASIPRDLRDEFAGLLEQLGPVQDLTAKSFNLDAAMLILAGISATADLLIDWRGKARRRLVRLDQVTIDIAEPGGCVGLGSASGVGVCHPCTGALGRCGITRTRRQL